MDGIQGPDNPGAIGGGAPVSQPGQQPVGGLPTGDPRANIPNPILQGAGAPQVTPTLEGAPLPGETPAQTAERLYAGKFKTPEEMERAYQESERNFHEGQMERSYQQRLLQQQEQLLQQLMGQQQQPQQPLLSPEDVQAQAEALLNRFYENPAQVMAEVVGQEVNKALQPLMERQQYQEHYNNLERQVNYLRQSTPDFDQLYPDVVGFLQTPQGRALATSVPNGVEMAYQVVKAQRNASYTPENILQDPTFRQQILQDPEIKKAILQEYGQGLQQNQPPVVIGSGQPNNIPVTPGAEIRNTEQAKAASIPFLSGFLKSRGGIS